MHCSLIGFHGVGVRLLLVVSVALGACTQDPSPGGSTSNETTSDSGETTVDPGVSSDSTASTSEGDSTSQGSTGPVPVPEPADCDALREQGACEALSGADFQCVWFPDAYPVMLDGSTCTIGEPIGWCLAAYTIGDTGCVDDFNWSCMEGEGVSNLFVREAEDTTVLIQDIELTGLDYGCGSPVLWDVCDAGEGPAACNCGCDPGLPQ